MIEKDNLDICFVTSRFIRKVEKTLYRQYCPIETNLRIIIAMVILALNSLSL